LRLLYKNYAKRNYAYPYLLTRQLVQSIIMGVAQNAFLPIIFSSASGIYCVADEYIVIRMFFAHLNYIIFICNSLFAIKNIYSNYQRYKTGFSVFLFDIILTHLYAFLRKLIHLEVCNISLHTHTRVYNMYVYTYCVWK